MKKNKITNLEIGSLIYFTTRAFLLSVSFNAIIKFTKQDSWYITLINIIPGIIFILFLILIMNYEPELNISEKIKKLFRKKISSIIIFLSIIFATFLGIINFLNLDNFIQSQFLSQTPTLAISLMFAIASYYILSKGINTICRTSVILLYISIILFILSFFGLLPHFNLSNLKPYFYTSIPNNINSLINLYVFNITPLFMITMIPKTELENKNIKKTFLISFIISSITIFIIVFSTISIFGYELSLLYEYPEFNILKSISFIGNSSRIESILSIQLLFDAFICNILIIYFIEKCISSLFKIKKEKTIYLLIITLFVIVTQTFSKYNIYIDNILIKGIPYFGIIITLIIDILIFIKIKKINKN